LLILEIAIRFIYADKKVDEYEVRFFKFLRSKLKISNTIINDNYDLKHAANIFLDKTNLEFAESIQLPVLSELMQVGLNIEKSE